MSCCAICTRTYHVHLKKSDANKATYFVFYYLARYIKFKILKLHRISSEFSFGILNYVYVADFHMAFSGSYARACILPEITHLIPKIDSPLGTWM